MSKPARSSPEKTDASPSSASAQGSPGARFPHAISCSTPALSAETLTSLEDIDDESDEEPLQLAQEAEHAATRQEGRATSTDPDIIVPRVILESETTKALLPKEWFKTLPSEDHVWLSKSIFDEGGKLRSQLQMWYHPPQIPLVFSQPPVSPNLFFHHRFFLWMPYRMWNARFL
ncbi:hypothetical protein ElyMa_005803700 [Elysia marginata]|uniref:DUF6729 domain-containing protein n=1 Tax=Elysia marginata TaxID=1093978 RepID=A0AAV4FU35_9GAST|nr:hypothetical protein ElyMa_005803700 [Elysia marginata]